ncbi:hypothetical protein [Iningainema tapete]|uniref:Uncharacterized protein n=1 Tax=Iningainema tapete BLCC-T55 TaxID=2748662 RepID=A0A8J7BX15_9CYAN|nr:hypothetical protein [Iningainema tapete]MBD2772053.1 hypothetical protein [Iningainema tapete BLCC-T55]
MSDPTSHTLSMRINTTRCSRLRRWGGEKRKSLPQGSCSAWSEMNALIG